MVLIRHKAQCCPAVAECLLWENALRLTDEIVLKKSQQMDNEHITRVVLRPGNHDSDFPLSQRSQSVCPCPAQLVFSTTKVNLHHASILAKTGLDGKRGNPLLIALNECTDCRNVWLFRTNGAACRLATIS